MNSKTETFMADGRDLLLYVHTDHTNVLCMICITDVIVQSIHVSY